MAVKYKMDEEARDNLDRRVRTGNECIDVAAGFTIPEESDENETYARDAVSHILTALFGPAGYSVWEADPNYSAESGVRFKEIALDEERGTLARTFLDMALESWEGDAEDYTAEIVTVDNPLLPQDEPKWYRVTLELAEDDLPNRDTDDPAEILSALRDFGGVVGAVEIKHECD